MQAHGLVHRLVLVVGLAVLSTAPASAQRCATSTVDDASPRGVRTAISAPVTAAPRPGLAVQTKPAPSAPAAPTRDDRKRARSTPNVKSGRSAPRVKAALPHSPASPGMGTLLKWTTGAGRDMSFLFEDETRDNRSDHIIAGRAPPGSTSPLDLLTPALAPKASILWTHATPGPDSCGPPPFATPGSHDLRATATGVLRTLAACVIHREGTCA